jgi:flagellar M-ring protein FliF
MAETEQAGGSGLQLAGADGGVGLRALAMVSALQGRLMAMPAGKRSWLIASVAFLAAVCAGMVWYAQRPDWRVLFSGLEGKDVQQVSQELAAAGIPFEMTPDGGGIEVPAEMLDKARMEVAAKGMPQTGRLGFELFDKPNWVGSEFDEKVNYQRALEGELEHTIESLGMVRSARVHLVLQQQSLYSAEEKAAKASVVLKLKRASLGADQVEAIRGLVAGAVDGLSPEQVTLVDADGRLNFKQRGSGGSGSSDAEAAEVEQAMEAKLVAMLEPLAGRDNVRATVNVSYEQGSEERTDEIYDPSQVAALTMQKSDQVAAQQARASGVPGTASNSPVGSPAGAVAGSAAAAAPGTPPLLQKETLPVYPQQGGQGQSLHEENGTYGVTKHLVHTEQGPGRVRRVTAAVVVNDRMATEGVGKLAHAVWKPRSADEMRRLSELAQAAVGFDAKRGDQVVMENVSFSTNAPEVMATPLERVTDELKNLLHSQPGMMRTLMMGLCGILLVLMVLRPVARQVTATLKETQLLTAGATHGMSTAGVIEVRDEAGGRLEEQSVEQPRLPVWSSRQEMAKHVSEQILRDPAQSTRLLVSWIGSSQETK